MNAIEMMVQAIADDGCGIVYDDAGSGCAGPGYAGPDTIREMLVLGDLRGAVVEPLDEARMCAAFRAAGVALDRGTQWLQVSTPAPHPGAYRKTFWIWRS